MLKTSLDYVSSQSSSVPPID